MIKKVKKIFHMFRGHMLFVILMREETVRMFCEKELQEDKSKRV